VISGFVITAMLIREWSAAGGISLRRFWRRRFFRLTPALALVIAVTFILSALLLYPLEQQIAYQTGLGALFLVANIVIARNTGGYFDAPAEGNPLLNTWSLSVEEQFYLIFPVILLATLAIVRSRRSLRWMPALIVALVGAVSLAVTFWSVTPAGSSVTWLNFYSPVTRSWEFAAGALLALLIPNLPKLSRMSATFLGLLGLAGIAASSLVITAQTPFPGPWTLLPVISTVLVIVSGSTVNSASTALGRAPLVRLGDWSYSIYLWHWPIIVFAIALGFHETPWLVAAALLSLAPALASFRYVEQPLRSWKPRVTWPRVAVASSILAIPIGSAIVLSTFATPQPRFQGTVGTTYLETIETTSFPCTLQQVPGSGSRCFQSVEGAPIDAIVVGDSHAEHLYLGVREVLTPLNVAYVYLPNWPYDTSENSRLTFEQISESTSIQTVVINSRWDTEGASSPELTSALTTLANADRSIFVADDGPTFSFHAEECQYELPLGSGPRCTEDSSEFLSRYQAYAPLLAQQVSEFPQTRLLSTSKELCQGDVCSMVSGQTLLFADHGHLNEAGSTHVIRGLTKSLASATPD
jgi:peptidoglycan/LPS O-acetylase OafA/YrhL